jgi:hypothetical protein
LKWQSYLADNLLTARNSHQPPSNQKIFRFKSSIQKSRQLYESMFTSTLQPAESPAQTQTNHHIRHFLEVLERDEQKQCIKEIGQLCKSQIDPYKTSWTFTLYATIPENAPDYQKKRTLVFNAHLIAPALRFAHENGHRNLAVRECVAAYVGFGKPGDRLPRLLPKEAALKVIIFIGADALFISHNPNTQKDDEYLIASGDVILIEPPRTEKPHGITEICQQKSDLFKSGQGHLTISFVLDEE